MSNNPKTVINYYVLCTKLKSIIRKGWKNWNVNRERLESVAEHIFGTQQLAIAMWSQYPKSYKDLIIPKVIIMLAVHELEEIFIGDLTQWDISKEEKDPPWACHRPSHTGRPTRRHIYRVVNSRI